MIPETWFPFSFLQRLTMPRTGTARRSVTFHVCSMAEFSEIVLRVEEMGDEKGNYRVDSNKQSSRKMIYLPMPISKAIAENPIIYQGSVLSLKQYESCFFLQFLQVIFHLKITTTMLCHDRNVIYFIFIIFEYVAEKKRPILADLSLSTLRCLHLPFGLRSLVTFVHVGKTQTRQVTQSLFK